MTKKSLSVFALVAVCLMWSGTSIALTNLWTGEVQNMPVIAGEGGPDVYGYTWVDSDTAIGPVFSWIDTTSGWTEVTGLFDDNVVGPIPLGFAFPYYWYTVDQIYVGSNGYISFSDATLEAAAFQPLPDPTRPNDVVAPLMDDLDFTVGDPSCYYWTNAATDTFIISYLDVRFWNSPASTNTFQIILSGPDSTITFQILDQTGPSQSQDSRSVGIEDVTGTVGLRYLFGYTPPENVIHDDLAILFMPPDSTTYVVTDAAVTDAGSEDSRGFIMLPTDSRDLWAVVKNTGNQVAAGFDVYGWIMDTLGTVYFGDTVTIASLDPGAVDTAMFTPSWTPPSEMTYIFKAKVNLLGDGVDVNDSAMAEVLVVGYPGEFTWVDDFTEMGMSWNGTGSGWANKFTPPQYPCLVQSVSARVETTFAPPKTITVQLLDDDTPDGSPGTVLADTTFTVSASGGAWYTYTLHPGHYFVFTDGSFFVGYIQNDASDPFIAMDFSEPKSRHGWEYTGSYAPHRDNDSMDIALKASVDVAPGPTLIQAYASDGPTQNPGIDDDDYVVLNFNTETNIPPLDAANIDAVLPLSSGHTWLSGDNSINSAVWSSDSTQLVIYLVTSGGLPTVAVGDTVYPDSVTITDRWGIPCESPRVIEGSFAVGVEESPLKRHPFVNVLKMANPNPFVTRTRIAFEVGSRTHTKVSVYDASGRTVSTLVDHVRDPGRYVIDWDGTDETGRSLGSGIYFVRMTAGSYSGTIKVGLLK
jgi:hypothetical protein